MKKILLQKKHIFAIIALAFVGVILAVSLILYFRPGTSSSVSVPTGILVTFLIFLILFPMLLVAFLFVKRKRLTFWIGSAIVSVAVLLMVFLVLIVGGVADLRPKLVFSSGTGEKVYDGTPLDCREWELLSGEPETGHKPEVTINADRTDAGSSENYFSVCMRDETGRDVTDAYKIVCRFGELRVLARPIAIRTNNASKTYDGAPLKSEAYQVVSGEIAAGQKLFVEVLGERTDAGISENPFNALITDMTGADVTRNYAIEKINGKIEIAKRIIRISTPSYQGVYDANPLTYAEWSYASDTKVLDRHTLEVTVVGSQTDVGVSKNKIGEVRITEGGNDVAYNYEVVFLEGDLIITPRKLTIRSESAKKTYDGKPLTNNSWSYASHTKPVEGQAMTVVISGTRTEAGESPNTIAECRVTNDVGRDVTFNYEIKLQEGSLIVAAEGQDTDPGGDPNGPVLDESGAIGTPDSGSGGSGAASSLAARVYAETAAKIYLRYMSFGDYTGTKWNPAPDYPQRIDSIYGMNYLTGIALKNAGYTSAAVSIEAYGANYLLPYYLDTDALSYRIQTSDVQYTGSTRSSYSAYCYSYDYENGSGNLSLPDPYLAVENAYYAYVRSTYLSIPSETDTFFLSVIEKNNFDNSDPSIVSRIAEFIRHAAIYNPNYNRELDRANDIAISFLSVFKEGICQHFASAATMLYRALGIPARYVIGYVGQTQSEEWTDVLSKDAHAWVEVYLRGVGWVQVEVTAAGIGEGEGGADESGTLTIKPVDVSMPYVNGVVLRPDNRVQGISDLLNRGYSYKAVITGKQTTVGTGFSTIQSFVLYDAAHADVTKQFKIKFGKGKLHLYVRKLTVTTSSFVKIYDGTPLVPDADGFSWKGELIAGHRIAGITVIGRQTNVGQSENICTIKIADEAGNDVTEMYGITNEFGTLTVNARPISIQAGSASKKYDGTALLCPTYEIRSPENETPLGQGDRITVSVSGSQTEVGRSQNEIVAVEIVNVLGQDVTKNYSVEYLYGWLTVTRS